MQIIRELVKTKEQFESLMQFLEGRVFGFDCETTGLDTHTCELVGVSFAAFAEGAAGQFVIGWYVPIDHVDATNIRPVELCKTGKNKGQPKKQQPPPIWEYTPYAGNFDKAYVIKHLKKLLENKDNKAVIANYKYERNVFRKYGVNIKSCVGDTQIMSYVINPDRRHGLKPQALEHFNYQMKEFKEMVGKGKNRVTFDKVPISLAQDYAADDAIFTLRLYEKYLSEFEPHCYDLFEMEMKLVEVIADMEYTGICFDVPFIKSIDGELSKILDDSEQAIYTAAGKKFNIKSGKQLGDVLFVDLKLPKTKRTKEGYSTAAKELLPLSSKHPIITPLLQYKEFFKIWSTYVNALPNSINEVTGRIHTSFNQTVTSTGRLSSSEPNLQNIPAQFERVRGAFVASNGNVLIGGDYSQIELRMLTEFTKDPVLIAAYLNNEDIHAATAAKVFNVPIEKVTKDQRRSAKAINFGLIYGKTAFSLAKDLDVNEWKAQAFIDKYFETYPTVYDFIQNTIGFTYKHGYVTTLYGRRRYFPDIHTGVDKIRKFCERACVNAKIQGSAADVIKVAMIEVSKALTKSKLPAKLLLQVHDELIIEAREDVAEDVRDILKTTMELGQPFDVPLLAEPKIGKSWLEIK